MSNESLSIMADTAEKKDDGPKSEPGEPSDGGDTSGKSGHGGAREGAGRPKGSKNKKADDANGSGEPGGADTASGSGPDLRRKEAAPSDEADSAGTEEGEISPADGGSKEPGERTARTAKRVTPRSGSGRDNDTRHRDSDAETDYTPYLILLGGAVGLALLFLARTRTPQANGAANGETAPAPDELLDNAIAGASEAWEGLKDQIAGMNDKLEVRLARR
jgi:hypothetical protein